MPIYNALGSGASIRSRLHERYSAIRAYDRTVTARYLQLMILAGDWAARQADALERLMDTYAFSAGQTTLILHGSESDTAERCRHAVQENNAAWSQIYISVIAAMPDDETEIAATLNEAAAINAGLKRDYTFRSSLSFFGVFTDTARRDYTGLRSLLARLEREGSLCEIYHPHMRQEIGDDAQALRNIAFTASLLPACHERNPAFLERLAHHKKTLSSGLETKDSEYSYRVVNGSLLNVEEAAAIKYCYDTLRIQQNAPLVEQDVRNWELSLPEILQTKLLQALTEGEKCGQDACVEKIRNGMLERSRMLPVIWPQPLPARKGWFSKKPLPEDIEATTRRIYGNIMGRPTLERYLEDSEFAQLRNRAGDYSNKDLCADLVLSCPNFAVAKTKLKSALKSVSFDSARIATLVGQVDSLLPEADDPIQRCRIQSEHCRTYMISRKLCSFLDNYLKERCAAAAEWFAKYGDELISELNNRFANEKLQLQESWSSKMGGALDISSPIINADASDDDPVARTAAAVFGEAVRAIPDRQESDISRSFIQQATNEAASMGIAEDANFYTEDLFIHNTEFSPPAGYTKSELVGDNVYYHMLALFSVRTHIMSDLIRFYR